MNKHNHRIRRGNTEAEDGEVEDKVIQSPVPSNIENGEEENETYDQQPVLDEASQTPNIEGDNLQHRDTLPESVQLISSELDTSKATPAESCTRESLYSNTTTSPTRRAAQRQRHLLQDLIDRELI